MVDRVRCVSLCQTIVLFIKLQRTPAAADCSNFGTLAKHTVANMAEDFLLRRNNLFYDISWHPDYFYLQIPHGRRHSFT